MAVVAPRVAVIGVARPLIHSIEGNGGHFQPIGHPNEENRPHHSMFYDNEKENPGQSPREAKRGGTEWPTRIS
jgi:hypothetical protein